MRLALLGLIALALVPAALAARLPFRHYTSADGLAQDSITCIAPDTDGFLWVGTPAGLSRFDGERFFTFGAAEGLEGSLVRDVAIGREGTHWVATEAGLFSFRPSEVPARGALFQRVEIEGIGAEDGPYRLLAARDGSLWIGTFRSLRHVSVAGSVARGPALDLRLTSRVQSLAEDPSGAVWVGTHTDGVFRISPDGRIDHLPASVPGADFVRGFRFDPDGSVFTSFFGGIAIFAPPVFPARPPAQLFGHEQGAPIDTKGFVDNGPDSVLVGSTLGVTELRRVRPGSPWSVRSTIDRRSGLPGDNVERLARDAAGNLWIGLTSRGLAKSLKGGFTTLEDANGPGAIVMNLGSGLDGSALAISFVGSKAITVARPGIPGAPLVRVNLPPYVRYTGWGATRKILQARDGSWWVGTGSGLFHYGGSPSTVERLASPPDARHTAADGLPGNDVFSIHEDRAGRLWVSATTPEGGASSLAVRRDGASPFEILSAAEIGTTELARSFADGPDGSLWISFLDGRLVRIRDGRAQAIPVPEAARREILDLFIDEGGSAWLLGRGWLYRGDARAASPRFEPYATRSDVSTTAFWCAVEDRSSRLWFGSSQGILRVDPATGAERRYTVEDGLASNSLPLCHRDGAGVLWFSDLAGLSRIDPEPDAPGTLAPARLREVRIAGEAVPLPALGGTSVGPLTVDPERRTIAIEFFAVHLSPGPPPRFQYQLEGADAGWSAATRDHRVQYARLAPGSYRFLVRTVDEEGNAHPLPAAVSLRVLAPLWQRGWFIALCAALSIAAVHGAYRLRLARVVALERVRTRIATDLHDDIGSSLSQIAILSQLARREIEQSTGTAPGALSRITELSGELVDALGDVVWAINPQRDRLSDLVHRMRRFASELFGGSDVALRLDLPEPDGDEPLDADVRRQVYLVFKEALHNARRHSGATVLEVELRRETGGLRLLVRDDGRGLPDESPTRGHGLASMRRRAQAIGADLEIRSAPGEGTAVVLRTGESRRRTKPSP